MANYISENDIEKSCCAVFMDELQYDEHLNLWQLPNDGNTTFGRTDAKEVVRMQQLQRSIAALNPGLNTEILDYAIKELTQSRAHLSPYEANLAVWKLLKDGYDVPTKNDKGDFVKERVRFMDFNKPENNHFAIVQQLTIKGKNTRRPDLLVYVNGLPLVFIELKNATEATRQAFDKNLTDYKRDIAQLFDYNLLVVLSNSLETKVGSMTSDWDNFFNWEKITSETDKTVPKDEIDLLTVLRGLFRKEVLMDMLENFVLYYANRAKIVAKNHQYLGVNNLIESFRNREGKEGKLGVFWHTQGSGKSFSMVYFVQKIKRKFQGNFKFVIVTDRDDLEYQIHKTFQRSGIIAVTDKNKKTFRAISGEDLKGKLKDSSNFVFTLIQKFSSEKKGKKYPVINDSDNIILIVDEAHRSQYQDLGENMKAGLPNAQRVAFTGTPLLDTVSTTEKWFGGYVSRYDFSDSVADGSTVPLFYHNRIPKVQLQNDTLNEEYAEILEEENISQSQQDKLTKEYAQVTTIITDNDRLDTIAYDIVNHFPYRGYLGKGMVISIDKPTAVKMYDKVKRHWDLKIKELRGELIKLKDDDPKKVEFRRIVDWMRETEMCVIVSHESDEETRFDKLGLNIRPHRAVMNKLYGVDDETIEDRFRNPNDKLRLVFVCAKWLTGFDAPTVSTLYLDKPMQNHTLMQTIARANRVAPALDAMGKVYQEATAKGEKFDKTSGLIIDYIGVFKKLEKALSKYAKPKDGKTEYPTDRFNDLLNYLEAAITEGIKFLENRELVIQPILNSTDTFENIGLFKDYADKLSKTQELKKEFVVYQNAITSFYQACKPEILEENDLPNNPHKGKYKRIKDAFEYLRKIIDRQSDDQGNIEGAKEKADILIDESIVSAGYTIEALKEIDLSQINMELLQKRFKELPYKHLSISDMQAFLKDRLAQMLNRNVSRIDLAEKLNTIIREYNSDSSDVEAFFEALRKYAEQLIAEDKRAAAEGLTEEELELFDLLFKEKLTIEEKQKVKLAAQSLLQKLKDNDTKRTIMVADWYKNVQLQEIVREMIANELNEHLPDSYDRIIFSQKRDVVYDHLFNIAQRGRGYWA